MLRQECGWFDKKENSVGFLSSNLSGDAANVQDVGIWNTLLDFEHFYYFIYFFAVMKMQFFSLIRLLVSH